MPKILLVEDDNNLREIYEARLQAEGYTIVSAKDGEEALVVAKSEKPDLIISDVMMPKISGFEMLDILRNTPELGNTKVIMLTALGQTEDQSRANRLGADRYLVKSQVTLEDIVKVSHELLGDRTTEEAAPSQNVVTPTDNPVTPSDSQATPAVTSTPAPDPSSDPAAPSVAVPEPAPAPTTSSEPAVVTPDPVTPSDSQARTENSTNTNSAAASMIQPVPMSNTTNDSSMNISIDANGQLTQTTDQPNEETSNKVGDFLKSDTKDEEASPNTQEQTQSQLNRDQVDNEQTLNNAVNNLVNNEAIASPAPAVPETQQTITPTTPTADAVNTQPNDANSPVSISGKKVIQPLGDMAKPESLDNLMAKEQLQESQMSNLKANSEQKPFDPNDPNSIAI